MKKRPEISLSEAKERAEALLSDVKGLQEAADLLMAECKEAIARVTRQYDEKISPLIEMLRDDEKDLVRLMKSAKGALFADGDIVYLPNGNLLYAQGDHVVIPRDALARCEEHQFLDVIKTVKSLDREAIEKWTDEKLILIGAERKPTETFNYEIKGEGK